LELPSGPVVKEPGQRVEIRPRVTPDPGIAESACQTDVAVLDREGKPTRVPGVGVKVNGRWAIDVRNPDGSLASHSSSGNSEIPGAGVLALSLARLNVIGLWSVQLYGSACSFGTDGICWLFENADDPPQILAGTFKGLSVSAPTNAGQLTLIGSCIAPQSGTVTGIETLNDFCPSGVLQTGCQFSTAGARTGSFSDTNQSVSVTAGQLVQVTVVFGFS
jgi:hypothetical protein